MACAARTAPPVAIAPDSSRGPSNQARISWTSAKGGQGRTLHVSGEPGVGKTRLLDALAREIAEEDAHVLVTRQGWIKRQPQVITDDLQRRLARIRWPDELPQTDWDYGTHLAYLQPLLAYWQSGDEERIIYVTPGYQMIALDAEMVQIPGGAVAERAPRTPPG